MQQPRATAWLICLIAIAQFYFTSLRAQSRAPAAPSPAATGALPTTREALTSKIDVWAEAALKQPDGPTYAFFEKLLPPLRYVDTRFRHYPINLSAPASPVKARLLSNGSQINAIANQPNWRNEAGIPVHIMVGPELEPFGQDLTRLEGPKLDQGYLPIVQLKYRHNDQLYLQEAFASTDPALARSGAVFIRLTLLEGKSGKVEAQLEAGHDYFSSSNDEESLAAGLPEPKELGVVRGPIPTTSPSTSTAAPASAVAAFDDQWLWNKYRSTLFAFLEKGESAFLVVFTKPVDGKPLPKRLDSATYFSHRELCIKTWNDLLARGATVTVPEPVVNNAWRATIIANYMMMHGDAMRYSAGNQYARLYIGEGGDATRALALWGQVDDAKRAMVPLFNFTRKGLEFHQAAFKLQMLAHVYSLTRDKQWLESHRALWEKEINVILGGREKETGMLPREKYCGDIETRVYSLNSNANCWRALRDMSVMLEDLGEKERAQQLAATATEYRKVILAAVEEAKRRDINPPFLPVALSGEEEIHDPVYDTRIGGYWNLMINYILGSGVFAYNSPTSDEVTKYLQTKGGLCMGMTRVSYGKSFWLNAPKINDLYGMRYALLLLQRDEPDRALVSFYGKLAQGFTRDTFIDGEASSLGQLDSFGRQFYLPPNSAANASFLQQLRYLLVQDYDLNDDGKSETLRLCFATPRPWLADGQTIQVKNAPTAFGPTSFTLTSHISRSEVTAEIDLPPTLPGRAQLRLRLPEGYKVTSAALADQPQKVDDETIELTGLTGHVTITAKVNK